MDDGPSFDLVGMVVMSPIFVAQGIVPKPLDATQMAALVELLKTPPVGEEEFLLDLLINRVPPGVDEAAYVKAGFLAAVAKGDNTSPLVTPEKAI